MRVVQVRVVEHAHAGRFREFGLIRLFYLLAGVPAFFASRRLSSRATRGLAIVTLPSACRRRSARRGLQDRRNAPVSPNALASSSGQLPEHVLGGGDLEHPRFFDIELCHHPVLD